MQHIKIMLVYHSDCCLRSKLVKASLFSVSSSFLNYVYLCVYIDIYNLEINYFFVFTKYISPHSKLLKADEWNFPISLENFSKQFIHVPRGFFFPLVNRFDISLSKAPYFCPIFSESLAPCIVQKWLGSEGRHMPLAPPSAAACRGKLQPRGTLGRLWVAERKGENQVPGHLVQALPRPCATF